MKLPLGMIVATPGILEMVEDCQEKLGWYIARHQSGEWGDVCEEDARLNDVAAREGLRVLSSYTYEETKFWIITEADRSATTLLLPDEY